MNLQVALDTDEDLLLAVVNGTMSFDAAWQVMKEICDTAFQKQLTRILVDTLGVQGVTTTIDRYTLGVKLVTYCVEHKLRLKLAFIGQPPVLDGFGITVARNRGLDTKVFLDRESAVQWVRG